MRKRYIIGNWKMHGSRTSVLSLLQTIKAGYQAHSMLEVGICPPTIFLAQTEQQLQGSGIHWGAQTVSTYADGAYTGEVSASMLADFGCHYVIIGHSERRQLFKETDAIIIQQFIAAIKAGLTPIICIGETQADYAAGLTQAVLHCQLGRLLAEEQILTQLSKAIIAYEPVWAIGTGLAATPEQAQNVHQFIRQLIHQYDQTIAANLPLIYGGSVKPANAKSLLAMADIDGGLIGSAALKAEDFLAIINPSID